MRQRERVCVFLEIAEKFKDLIKQTVHVNHFQHKQCLIRPNFEQLSVSAQVVTDKIYHHAKSSYVILR